MRSAIVITSLFVASVAMADDLDAAARAKLAEMMAFVRDGPEQAAMRAKMGLAKWCALYRIEMGAADAIAKLPR